MDGLIRDGLTVELWEAAKGWGWRQPRHLLIRADRIDDVMFGRLIRVHGRRDVVGRLGPGVVAHAGTGGGPDGGGRTGDGTPG